MRHNAVYIRVSTNTQDHASQLPDLERYAQTLDGETRFYRDTFSGRTMDRPGLNALLAAIKRREVERLIVWRLDRLGRTARGLCDLFETLREAKVDLISVRDGFTLNTPAGRLHAQIIASVAEYETEIRAERVKAGQAVARAKGKKWGGTKPGHCAKLTGDKLRLMNQLIESGQSISSVARAIGFSRKAIYYNLKIQEERQSTP